MIRRIPRSRSRTTDARPSLACAFLVAFAAVLLYAAPARANEKYAAIVVDAASGDTLFARFADARRYPASLTKIMTLYVVFEEMKAGRLASDTPMRVSAHAAARPPSKLGFKPGQTIRAEDAIKALVTKSANDVATVVAEHIAGSESAFAARMTRTARRLGMRNTVFKNASGLPDDRQVTTARDMARLGMAIQQHFPDQYAHFKLRSFAYRGQRYRNHNRLLGTVDGVDGIKTGYIRASGFNLVTSVRRDGRHIVAVVMGGRTGASRNAHMSELIETHIGKASVGGADAKLLIAAAPVPLPPRKPYAVVLTALIERSLSGNLAVAVSDDSLIDRFDFADRSAAAKPRTLVAAAPAGPAEPAPSAPTAAVAPSAEREAPTVRTTALAARRPAPAAGEALGYAADPVEAMVAQVPDVELGSSDEESEAGPPVGWHIQIAAVDSEAEASRILTAAQQRFAAVLGERGPYTMAVDAGGETLYRARFVGFASKDEAWRACRQLGKAKQPCWAEMM